MLFRSGVSKEIIARLHQEIVKAVNSPDVKTRLEHEGAEIVGNTPEQASALIHGELAKWADVIKRTGITAN